MARKAGNPSKWTAPPKPAGARWTDAQWAGVSMTGGSLLISAAAGSGKTAVLAERCAYLVCDAPAPCSVDELLVVTFTEAAASEMKHRIGRALRQRIERSPDPRLSEQLALIDRAQVSTLHAFCAKLIRQHFHALDLDPSFSVLDGDDASLLRREIARSLFEERYDSADSAAFRALIDAYADGNDERLIGRMIQTYELSRSLRDPAGWISTARARIAEGAEAEFRESVLGRAMEREIAAGLAELHASCERAVVIVSGMKGFDKYIADLRACEQILRHWSMTLKEDGLDALAEEARVELPRLPTVPESTPGKKVAKTLVDAVRSEIKDGELRRMLAFSTAQWRQGLASVLPHAESFLDLVERFAERYEREKAALRSVDFSDLEQLALRALRDRAVDDRLAPSPVARLLHRQFVHVLVDEYQDINEVQDAILHLASRECLWDQDEGAGKKDEDLLAPNLFCVGDVKQSIYRFRLAEPARFLERQERFRDDGVIGTVVDLQHNFRSRAPLLEGINDVFRRLMTRAGVEIEYDASQQLYAGREFPAGDAACFTGAPIELHLLPPKPAEEADEPIEACDDDELDRNEREAVLIARRIAEIVGGGAGCAPMQVVDADSGLYRPIRYGDIVILLRSMRRKGDDYAEILRRSGIPVHNESGSGYFDSMEVNDILGLLKVLDNRAQDIPLAAVLRSPIAGLPEPEDALACIRLAYADRSIPFHQAVVRYAFEQDDELAAKLKDVLNQLDHWRTLAQRRPLAEVIWDIYDSTGYLAFCAGLRDGEQRKANLIDLHDRARQFGSFQRQGLARFLAFLDQLREQADLGQSPVVSEGENVVRIMTIHHSKGLEFPVVFIPDLGKRINLQDCSGSILIDRCAYLGMDVVDQEKQVRYPSLASTIVSRRLRRQSLAEELRVLYVAMTRAKEHLVLVGTAKTGAADDWSARWAQQEGPLPVNAVLGASSMLDWLGPVAAATSAAASGRGDCEPIRIHEHTAEEVLAWPAPESLRPLEGERQRRLARLELLKPDPAPDPAADQIIQRLTTPYPHAAFTRLPAVESATALTKKGAPSAGAATSGTAPSAGAAFSGRLELPRSIRPQLVASAADVGEATHLVLQHLDFAQPCDVSNLKTQLDVLVSRRLISASAARDVDLESLCWLAGSPVGELIREHASTLRRELPLYLALPPAEFDSSAISSDPQDRIMVRSRLDLLLRTAQGFEIVDYKTDRVRDQALQERVQFYQPQMALYRRAVQAITGEAPAAVHLVFLHARQVVTV